MTKQTNISEKDQGQERLPWSKKWPRSKNTCISIKRFLRQEQNKIPELENYYPDNYITLRTTCR